MVDHQTICCMCGDVGFPDQLFFCTKCRNRFQHSYCSNYYSESSETIKQCDWCQIEEKSVRHGSSSKKSVQVSHTGAINRSECPGEKIKQSDQEESRIDKGKNTSGLPSPRPTTRKYKLLKDVMC